MFRQSTQRVVFSGALLLLGLTAALSEAQDLLRLTRNVPGDSKPIVLYADEVATWSEGGRRVVMLKGGVWAEQGLVNVRAQRAVVWVDEDAYQRTRILHATVFADGEVSVENGPKAERASRALLEINTRGELKLKSQTGKIIQQKLADDPFYVRALAEKSPPAPVAPRPPSAADKQVPKGPPAPPTGIQRTGFQEQVPGQPAPSAPPAGPAPGAPSPIMPAGPQGALPPTKLPQIPATPLPPGTTPAGNTSGAASGLLAPQGKILPAVAPGTSPVPGASAPGRLGGLTPPARPGPTPPAENIYRPTTSGPTLLPVPPSTTPLPPRSPGSPSGQQGLLVPRQPADGPPRVLTVAPRFSTPFQTQSFPMPDGEQAIVVTGGVILMVKNVKSVDVVDIEADRLVFWTKGNSQELFNNMRSSQGQASRELEFYLAGNVEIRSQSRGESRVLRADEVYYDVSRNVAVGATIHSDNDDKERKGVDLEIKRLGLADPVHMKAEELIQYSPTLYEATQAEVYSSRLPSDPGLKVYLSKVTLQEERQTRRSIFGREIVSRRTGQAEPVAQHYFKGDSVFFEVADVPIFYLPYLAGTAERPFGPLVDATLGFNRIYGFQTALTFDVYDLIGIERFPGTRWRADVDYFAKRGWGGGSTFDYGGIDLFEIPGKYEGKFKAWGLAHDNGQDVLGGTRTGEPHPNGRGRVLYRHNWWELPAGFTVQAGLSMLSDKNFLEQFYKDEFDVGLNQETFVYVKQQQGNWAWTGLAEPRLRVWVTETEWLPRFDGHLLGISLFDLFTYNTHASAGYAQLKPTQEPPPPVLPTQVRVDTGRFDLWQDLSLPFYLGPVKLAPYGIIDLTAYTEDIAGDQRGRFYGAGGLRGSMPFTRIFPSVESELFNVNGFNHKIVFAGNYYLAHSDTLFSQLPLLDPIDDDATDQARRDITPQQSFLNPQHGLALATSPLYNPQLFVIRRLVDNRVDTLNTIEVLQADVRQRLQTKRGYPGMQHIVDWMTLDLSGSYFPHSGRDNFGQDFAFLQYDWLWNIGDRTALVSTGWFDPGNDAPRVFTFGSYINRPDRTTFFVGYRSIYPLNSQAVTGAVTYIFSPKYAFTFNTVYDFGIQQSLSNSLIFTRMGSDVQLSLGITYNAILNNFGVNFMVVPNLLPSSRRLGGGGGGLGSNGGGLGGSGFNR